MLFPGRLTLVTNVALGIFVFATSFVRRLQLRKKVMLQSMMAANNNSSDTFNSILQEAYIQSIAASWYFYVSAICLASDTAWKRNVGIGISTIASFWAIFKVRFESNQSLGGRFYVFPFLTPLFCLGDR